MRLAILGSTGEIGKRSISIASALKNQCEVALLLCNKNWEILSSQIRELKPRHAVVVDKTSFEKISKLYSFPGTTISNELSDVPHLIQEYGIDTVISSTIGTSLIKTNYDILGKTKRILIANKESIVLAGNLFLDQARKLGTQIVPLDSEHFGLYRLLNTFGNNYTKLYITASGGPFREYTHDQLQNVTPAEALNHPIWKMGKRITVDSATLVNKALEVIEAHYLFSAPPDKINVLIHPQSIVHAMVEYNNSIYAQMSSPMMEIPIQEALTNTHCQSFKIDFAKMKLLSFELPDSRHSAIDLGFSAIKNGKSYPIALNAADEIAVENFLSGRIKFLDILSVIKETMSTHKSTNVECIEDVITVDKQSRSNAEDYLRKIRC